MDSTRTGSAPPEPLVPEERIGQYARLEEIGRGGQSTVWLAIDGFLGREVALKEVLPPPLDLAEGSEPAAAWSRFLREARLTARLDHPSIVPIHELARRPDGRLFCAQKLVRGETLKARLGACTTLEERLALVPHIISACQAMAYAHARGVIHRDLKPSNIMVGSFGETVVVDWGLAKQRGEADELVAGAVPAGAAELTVAGFALGTPAYMSPEQARGAVAEVDERSDVYSLGVVLYEVLTGSVPFAGQDAAETMARVLEGRLRPVRELCPEAPPELAAVAERALQHAPADRYPGAGPLAEELAAFRAGGRVAAFEYRAWDLVKKFIANHRGVSAVSLAALLILIGSSIVIARQLQVTRRALADSFLERARNAEQQADWARAAGYYAAARVERDSPEGRWGYALAYQKMPRRTFTRRAADRSFVDVAFLPDGRALVVGLQAPWVIARDPESGRELWRHRHSEPLTSLAVMAGGQVRLELQSRDSYLDGATGRSLADFARGDANPCRSAPVPARALFTAPATGDWSLIAPQAGGEPHVLMPSVGTYPLCAASGDGERLAVRDGAGVVHLWDLVEREEITSRSAPDASEILFTAHGVAVVRGGTIQVFGGDGGDFFVALPGRGHKAVASPDGHRLVVTRKSSNQADIVDLRARAVVSSLSFASGAARFAFSPSGDRLVIAGILDGTVVSAWDLRMPAPSAPVPSPLFMGIRFSRDGRRIAATTRDQLVGLYDPGGALLRVFDLGGVEILNFALSADGRRLALAAPDRVHVFDAGSGAEISRLETGGSSRLDISGDGGRVLTSNRRETALWDVERRQAIWTEPRPRPFGGPLGLTPDGRHVVWGGEGVLHFHAVDGRDQELALAENLLDATFSYDSRRLAVVSSRSISVWEMDGLRPVFRVPNPTSVYQEIYWSGDGSALFNVREFVDTVLLDSRTGRALATFDPSKPAGNAAHDLLSPDLRYRLARGDGAWDIRPLPVPDVQSPRDSLARVLEEAGLEMQGVELVFATGAP